MRIKSSISLKSVKANSFNDKENYLLLLAPDSRMNHKTPRINKELIQFFLLTYLISWSIWGTIILFPKIMGEMYILIIIGAFGPFISATIITRRQHGKEETKKWRKNILSIRKHIKWHLIGGLGIPIIIALLHIGYYGAARAGSDLTS